MTSRKRRALVVALTALILVPALVGCDPANDLENEEYRAYLGSFKSRDLAVVVAAFNQFDAKRGDFKCQAELESAQRAVWREQIGTVEPDRLDEMRAFKSCLRSFFEASGVKQGLVTQSVLTPWVNHNFMPEIRGRIDAEVSASQKRLGNAGCGGEACEALVVIGDLAVPRLGAETPVAWPDAQQVCSGIDHGGLGPWRLPTKAELVAIHNANKVASEIAQTSYWSADREIEDEGQGKVWVLRFDLASRGDDAPGPELLPLEHRGRPRLAKVRCVHDLSKRQGDGASR